jgi:hypothetical protein
MSARTDCVNVDCCCVLGTPPKAEMTAGLVYHAWGLPVVRVDVSAYGPVPKLTYASTGAVDGARLAGGADVSGIGEFQSETVELGDP